jgi:IS5 family transposase
MIGVPSAVWRLVRFRWLLGMAVPAPRSRHALPTLYADAAYRSAETEAKLRTRGLRSRVHERACRSRVLSKAQERANRQKSKIRARVEHVFGAQQTSPGGRIVRTIGIMQAKAKIGLQNLAYNIRRLVTLERLAAA